LWTHPAPLDARGGDFFPSITSHKHLLEVAKRGGSQCWKLTLSTATLMNAMQTPLDVRGGGGANGTNSTSHQQHCYHLDVREGSALACATGEIFF